MAVPSSLLPSIAARSSTLRQEELERMTSSDEPRGLDIADEVRTLATPDARLVLAVLAVLGRASVSEDVIASCTGLPDVRAALADLERRGLVVREDGDRHAAAPGVQEHLKRLLAAADVIDRVLRGFIRIAEDGRLTLGRSRCSPRADADCRRNWDAGREPPRTRRSCRDVALSDTSRRVLGRDRRAPSRSGASPGATTRPPAGRSAKLVASSTSLPGPQTRGLPRDPRPRRVIAAGQCDLHSQRSQPVVAASRRRGGLRPRRQAWRRPTRQSQRRSRRPRPSPRSAAAETVTETSTITESQTETETETVTETVTETETVVG